MTKFNDRLKAAMSEANLTQAALAGMVDVSKASMSCYLSGKVNPPEKKKEQIALALGKSADYFRVLDVNTEIAADGGYRMPVELAASLMGLDVKTVRSGLQNGELPFGYAIKNGDSTKFTYWISRIKFSAETGIPVPLVGEMS